MCVCGVMGVMGVGRCLAVEGEHLGVGEDAHQEGVRADAEVLRPGPGPDRQLGLPPATPAAWTAQRSGSTRWSAGIPAAPDPKDPWGLECSAFGCGRIATAA